MADSITITLEEWTALVALAREGNQTAERQRDIARFVTNIETRNSVTRYRLWVLWQEAGKSLPASTSFPTSWPPELRRQIERTDRPIAKADVDAMLTANAVSPIEVMVTRDPGGEFGWTPYATYFRTST